MTKSLIVPPASAAAPTRDALARAKKYFDSHIAASTLETYESAFKEFADYCAWKEHPALPTNPAAIVDYITFLAEGAKSVAWIQVTLASISYFHRMRSLADPTDDTRVGVIMKGIRRQRKVRPTQKEPITRAFLDQMLAQLSDDTLVNRRDRALLLLGFAGAFRQSELAGLDVTDVQLRIDEMVITLRSSKTDQEGRGTVKRIPRLRAGDPRCPVQSLEAWLGNAKLRHGPLFRRVDRHGNVGEHRMNPRSIAFIVKRDLPASADTSQYAGHSLRAGFVTQAAQDGTPEYEIQEVTKHKSSEMLRRYIRDQGIGQHDAIRRALTGED